MIRSFHPIRRIVYASLLALPSLLTAKTLYLSPTGHDANPGTESAPVATLTRAQALASSGDTVLIAGGHYVLTNAAISSTEAGYAYVDRLTRDHVSYLAAPGPAPVFDFSLVKPAGKRVCAILVEGDGITLQGFEIVGVQVTIAHEHTQSEAIRVEGSHNQFRLLKIHNGMGIGLYMIKNAGHNLVENCDAYDNTGLDEGSIGNIDGFGCHVLANNPGNVFRGRVQWAKFLFKVEP